MSTPSTVDDYIAAQPAAAQSRLRELREAVRGAAPGATETISYGMPTYRYAGRRVHFGAAKHHCALYGVPLDAFADELRAFKTSRGTVRLPLDEPVPVDLVRRLVAAKLAGAGA